MSTDVVQQKRDIRWKIEEFHRELKQLTGVEAYQCRKARIQRNHIACALTRLATPESDCLSNPSDRLQGKAPDAVKLLDSATQMPICSDGACVSPDCLAWIVETTTKPG